MKHLDFESSKHKVKHLPSLGHLLVFLIYIYIYIRGLESVIVGHFAIYK